MAEIKLLLVMQEDVNRRTIELQERIGGRQPTDAEATELTSLSTEQGQIARLVSKMTDRAAEAQTDDAPQDPNDLEKPN